MQYIGFNYFTNRPQGEYSLYLGCEDGKLKEVKLNFWQPYITKVLDSFKIKSGNDWIKFSDIVYLDRLINNKQEGIQKLHELLCEEDYERIRKLVNEKIQAEIDEVSKKLVKKY